MIAFTWESGPLTYWIFADTIEAAEEKLGRIFRAGSFDRRQAVRRTVPDMIIARTGDAYMAPERGAWRICRDSDGDRCWQPTDVTFTDWIKAAEHCDQANLAAGRMEFIRVWEPEKTTDGGGA